jgi:hypothetical protein
MADTASRPLADQIVRVTVEEIDRATVDRFIAEITAHDPGPYCLVVDVRDVTFIDARGVRSWRSPPRCVRRAGSSPCDAPCAPCAGSSTSWA